jgi:fatty-acyl-CoA synthase
MTGTPKHTVSPWLPGTEPGARIVRGIIRSEADARAIEQIPADQLLAGRTILDCIRVAASFERSKSAIVQLLSSDLAIEPRRLSYAEVLARTVQAANLFKALSGDEQPSVAIIAPFLPEALIATWGGATAGVATPLNPALDIRQIASIMIAARSNILVTTTSKYGPGAWERVQEIAVLVPNLRSVLVIDSLGSDDFMAALATYSAEKLSFVPCDDPEAVVTHIPTGGTTGAPKLVRLTNRGQLLNAWLFGALFGSGPDEVLGHAMPNFHVGGLVALALRGMIFGQTVLTLTPAGFRDQGVIRNFWDIARRYGMTGVIMAPATVAALLNQNDTSAEGHSIRNFICGGSTIPVELMHDFYARTGIYLKETWGMTEFQGPCSGHPANGAMPVIGSVGRAYPYHKVRVVHLDGGAFVADAPTGERGILAVTGPTLSPGYVDERLSSELFVRNMPDGRVWASTGDLGTVDADGYIWVYGREKDLIIRGGGNIDPKLIEEVLARHPAILLSAAIGRPDAMKGELPIVYVQLKDGVQATPDEILTFCRSHMTERAAIPVEAIILPIMPMTAVAKIAKPALRLDAMQRVVTEVAKSIIGSYRRTNVTIDESGKRPAAIIQVEVERADREGVLKRLRDAYAGFAFKTDIQLMEV